MPTKPFDWLAVIDIVGSEFHDRQFAVMAGGDMRFGASETTSRTLPRAAIPGKMRCCTMALFAATARSSFFPSQLNALAKSANQAERFRYAVDQRRLLHLE